MSGPELTIIFPTYHRLDEVAATLSYLSNNGSCDYEVIVLDNSSHSYEFTLQSNESYVFMDHNAGAEARNVGIQRARSSYILMLDLVC